MPKLWRLEGHSRWPPLPGPVTSTWHTEAGVPVSGRRIQLLRRWLRRGRRKGKCEPRFQFKGPDSAQLLGGPSRLVTTLAHEDTVEGRDKAAPRPPLANRVEKGRRKVNKSSQIPGGSQGPAGHCPQSGRPSLLQRLKCHPDGPGLQSTHAQRALGTRGPQSRAAPSQETEKSEDRGE